MPIYEYRCKKCRKIFERFQKISDDPLKECPDCNGRVLRLISETSFSLKGDGWYKDGYSSKKGEEAAKKEKTEKTEKTEEKKEKAEKKTEKKAGT